MNKYISILKENLIIIIPTVIVVSTLIGFLIFGFLKPSTTAVIQEDYILDIQEVLEDEFLLEYSAGIYDEEHPFFVLNPYQISPLSGLILFETDEVESFIIVVNGKEIEGNIEFASIATRSHKIPVYGLYANYENKVEIYENILGEKGILVSELMIQTSPLKEESNRSITLETTSEYFSDDIMILMPATQSLPIGIDYNGDIRWTLTENFSWAPVLLENGHLLLGSDRLMSDPYYVTSLYEIDYLGKIYKEYKIPGGYHHDVVELPNNNLLVLTNEFEGTVEDMIIEINHTTGEIVNTWDLKHFLDQTQGMSQMWTSYDWFHNNSIDYDETTNSIILSGRHQDIVVSISLTTNRINYIIGDPNNWSQALVDNFFLTPIGENFEWQYAQHGAIYTEEGIFIFDNGNNKSKFSENYVNAEDSYSRGVMYVVDGFGMTIEQTFQFGKELGSSFYSPYISNVQYLGPNNYMIHSGGHSEVNSETLNVPAPLYNGDGVVRMYSNTYEVESGIVKYHLEIDDNYYQALHTSLYTEATTYYTGTPVSFGELAETPKNYDELSLNFNFLETVPLKFNISFVKQKDRLVVNGTFDRNDEIYIVLRNNIDFQYQIPTSNTAYTAMCLGTFIGDSRELTYYINETNLEGEYEIYLVVNNVEYNTYQHVTFD